MNQEQANFVASKSQTIRGYGYGHSLDRTKFQVYYSLINAERGVLVEFEPASEQAHQFIKKFESGQMYLYGLTKIEAVAVSKGNAVRCATCGTVFYFTHKCK